MCGIFGVYKYKVPSSRKKALGTVLGGLRQLEYRGCAPMPPIPSRHWRLCTHPAVPLPLQPAL